ncbi:hypothetical protein KY285_010089 [Solanum tuberosum]|nr:hypothetical protein KY285_010089 [Solanum tuberosum]
MIVEGNREGFYKRVKRIRTRRPEGEGIERDIHDLPSYDTFVYTLLYGKDNISLDDVSNALKSKELKKSFSDSRTEGEGLVEV